MPLSSKSSAVRDRNQTGSLAKDVRLRSRCEHHRSNHAVVTREEAEKDLEAIIDGFKLQAIRRFHHQRYWETESREADYAARIEDDLRLENVAAHSWHVADATLICIGHFEWLKRDRCLELALVHDKLEMFTGDFDPVGKDGTGAKTHAFSRTAQGSKLDAEQRALDRYLARLRPSAVIRRHCSTSSWSARQTKPSL
jgi:hypothetical protein